MFKRILSILLIATIGLLIINKAVFTHTHTLDNGSVVTHAHPYSSGETHQHNDADYLFFAQLGFLFFVAAFILSSINIIYKDISRFCKPNLLLLVPLYATLSDRAPPATV